MDSTVAVSVTSQGLALPPSALQTIETTKVWLR